MIAVVDTNVVLDVLLDRQPFAAASAAVFALAERSEIKGLLCATTLTTADYLLKQFISRTEARQTVSSLMRLFEVAPVNRPVLEQAVRSKVADFEDAVMDEAGLTAGAEAVITRNVKDFRHARLKVFDPEQFLTLYGRKQAGKQEHHPPARKQKG